jgi:hypothetical protein
MFNKVRTIEDVPSEAMTTSRLLAWLLGALASIALALCLAGVYGLVANSVTDRRRELGVRMALGAASLQILRTTATAGITPLSCSAVLEPDQSVRHERPVANPRSRRPPSA